MLAATPSGGDEALKQALHDDLEHYLCTRSSIEHISTLSMTISFRGVPEDIKMAVGTTQYGGGEKVTPSNVFQIGSNTKAYTSAIILKLEADGVLSIEDTLGKWLPQYPAWSKATIRELLNMTSGIPTYDATPAWEASVTNDPYAKSTPEELVAFVYPTLHQPGKWEYSNTGYILAQMVIDKASWWHSYQAELDRLFAMNNLRNTFYEPNFYPTAVTRRLVSGYYVNTDDPGLAKLLGRDTKNFSLGWTQAAGGIIATPTDMTTWVRNLFEGDVLPPQQKNELQSLVAIPGGEPITETSAEHPQGFGLGIFQITAPPQGLFWGYQGSTLGYRAAYTYLPDSGLIITVFTNSQAPAAESTVNTVLFAQLYETLKCFGKI
ncbi:MAG TPA: serine hydrolase domain-containing protein [Acidobacteriaceae bacterium]|nr:serine hydrolase domain-containing protein [Acidobacteriaceae bacterium]